MNFGFIFVGQNGENLMKNGMRKYCFFQHQIFSIFFRIFAKFVRFGEGLGLQKIEKIAKNGVQAAFGIHLKLKALSQAIFEGFWLDFLRFWTDLGRIFSIFGGG